MSLFYKKEPGLSQDKDGEKYKKAAKLLLSLGDEKAADVIKHLDENTIQHVALEIAKIRKVDQNEKKDLLQKLKQQVLVEKENSFGGVDTAFEYLTNLIGEDKAKEKIEKIQKNNYDFRVFENYPLKNLIEVFSAESSQTIAVLLSQLRPEISAKILSGLTKDIRGQVALKIAKLRQINETVLQTLYASLKKKLDVMAEQDDGFDGEETLKTIMAHLDKKSENQLLSVLEKEDRSLYEKMKARDLIFENLMYLTIKEIRKLFEVIKENHTWALALKGAGTRLIRHILSSVSINRASDIQDEMQLLKKVPLNDVHDARHTIMQNLDSLIKQGDITSLDDPQEEYTE